MKDELKAYRFFRKNKDFYFEKMKTFWGDTQKLQEMFGEIASRFDADPAKLMQIYKISYERKTNRSLKQYEKRI